MPDIARLQALAEEVMALSRNAIVMNLRFMDMAVFRLRAEPADVTLATDGQRLWYGPEHVLRRYMQEEAQLRRDYLHVLLHCVFRHPFIDSLVDRECWDLAADIAVEALIIGLEAPAFAVSREAAQREVVGALQHRLGLLTAEKLYRYFQDNPPPPDWVELFQSDRHDLWHRPKQSRAMREGRRGEDGDDGGESDGSKSQAAQEDEAKEEKASPPEGQSGDREEIPESTAQAQTMSPENPPVRDEASRAYAASTPDAGDDEAEGRRRMMQSEAGGDSGETAYRKADDGRPQNQNAGPGMDTEGGENSTPAGAQSRNDRTQSGVDSPTANGVSGDSADARSQSADSHSGGSGSGLNDAQVMEAGGDESGDGDWLREREQGDRERLKREWQDVSERIQLDLEAQSHQRGALPGSLQRQLELGNRERHDYAAFLRKFAVMGEHMQLNDDEFDQIFYTYGLKLYGNLPLIEPLETKEVKRIREFVIAIDTSGSTSGALVERFLRRTYDILSSEESFFKKINLRILQCDAQIQESATIQSREDFERYMRSFTAKGLGGTDFRPVFEHVDELLRRGEFTQLRGLIYFTDGQGAYPARKPDYEAAFVFLESDDAPAPEVPPWAIRLVLDERQITEDDG